MIDIIDEIQKVLDENSKLIEENTFLKETCQKLKDREKLYMSALQNTKNDLERLARRVDTTPHSSDKEYGIKYYGKSEG